MHYQELTEKLEELFAKEFVSLEWSPSPDPELGILSTNYAFRQAKELRQSPKEIAEKVAQQINQKLMAANLPVQAKAVGAYINLDLSLNGWDSYMQSINSIQLKKDNQKLILEYICLNVAKPLHAGHMLQANYAESLRRILKLKYERIVTNNYWGDWGVQFGILIWAWKTISDQSVKVSINGIEGELKLSDYDLNPIDTLVKVYVWGNAQQKTVENWESLVRGEHLKLEQGDQENQALWRKFLGNSQNSVRKILQRLNVKPFDLEEGESVVEKEMQELIQFLDQNNLWIKEDKGRYIDTEWLTDRIKNISQQQTKDLQTFGRCYLIQSKDGYTTYALRDIAAKIRFARNLQFDKYITFVGNEQMHHFNQVYTILDWLSSLPGFEKEYGIDVTGRLKKSNLGNIFNGILGLSDMKMSARKGNFLTAEQILDEVEEQASKTLLEKSAITDNLPRNSDNTESQATIKQKSHKVALAALKWFNLNRDITQNSILDIPTILKFEGNTGVYQLYTLARLNSILKKNATNLADQIDFTLLNLTEQNLIKKTWHLTPILEKICENYKPHLLTTYLFELATEINSWYTKYSVTAETDLARKSSLLQMCTKLKAHIAFCLDLLAIIPVEEL